MVSECHRCGEQCPHHRPSNGTYRASSTLNVISFPKYRSAFDCWLAFVVSYEHGNRRYLCKSDVNTAMSRAPPRVGNTIKFCKNTTRTICFITMQEQTVRARTLYRCPLHFRAAVSMKQGVCHLKRQTVGLLTSLTLAARLG